eukprot:tig00021222_g19366.t1
MDMDGYESANSGRADDKKVRNREASRRFREKKKACERALAEENALLKDEMDVLRKKLASTHFDVTESISDMHSALKTAVEHLVRGLPDALAPNIERALNAKAQAYTTVTQLIKDLPHVIPPIAYGEIHMWVMSNWMELMREGVEPKEGIMRDIFRLYKGKRFRPCPVTKEQVQIAGRFAWFESHMAALQDNVIGYRFSLANPHTTSPPPAAAAPRPPRGVCSSASGSPRSRSTPSPASGPEPEPLDREPAACRLPPVSSASSANPPAPAPAPAPHPVIAAVQAVRKRAAEDPPAGRGAGPAPPLGYAAPGVGAGPASNLQSDLLRDLIRDAVTRELSQFLDAGAHGAAPQPGAPWAHGLTSALPPAAAAHSHHASSESLLLSVREFDLDGFRIEFALEFDPDGSLLAPPDHGHEHVGLDAPALALGTPSLFGVGVCGRSSPVHVDDSDVDITSFM